MKLRAAILIVLYSISVSLYSQGNQDFALPFLNYTTNARVGGIAEIGSVTSAFYKDAGIFQNPSTLSFNSVFSGTDLYFQQLNNKNSTDMWITGWSGYHAFNSKHAVGFNFVYLNYDEPYTNSQPDSTYKAEPYDLFLQGTYKYQISNLLSLGLGVKYIRSNYAFMKIDNQINTFSVDLGLNYTKSYTLSDYSNLHTSAGVAITNFGPRISNPDTIECFIPTKCIAGLYINPDIYLAKKFNLNIELYYQAEKYLIPSLPEYNNEGIIVDGRNPDISIFKALYQSFYDSPDGFSGEIDEIRNKFGSEFRFSYTNIAFIALRHGRIFETESAGGGNYQTFGCGIGFLGFIIDYLYIENNSNINQNWAVMVSARHNLNGDLFRF